MDIVRNLYRSRAQPQAKVDADLAPASAAEEWFAINLDKEINADRRAEFEAWLREPENAAAYWRVHQVWNTIGRYAREPRLDELTRQALAETESFTRTPRTRSIIPWLLAGSVAVASLAYGTFWGDQFFGMTFASEQSAVATQVPALADVGMRSPLLAASAIQWGVRDPSASEWR